MRKMPNSKGQKRKRKVTLLETSSYINESSIASIQSVGEDPNEDDERPVGYEEPVPDEGGSLISSPSRDWLGWMAWWFLVMMKSQ